MLKAQAFVSKLKTLTKIHFTLIRMISGVRQAWDGRGSKIMGFEMMFSLIVAFGLFRKQQLSSSAVKPFKGEDQSKRATNL
jgi:hypothetical protein